MSNFAKVETIHLGNASLDVYLLPTGEQRIGVESGGLILGNSKDWISTVTSSPSTWLDELKERGFSGDFQDVYSINSKQTSSTISLKDFTKIVVQEAVNGDLEAIIILSALAEIGIERLITSQT